MAKEPKTGKGGGTLAKVVYALLFLQFVYFAYDKVSESTKKQPRIDDPLPTFIDNIYCPMTASASGKVLFYIVDANDQSGSVKLKSGDPTETIYINIPSTESKDLIKSVKESIKIKAVKFVRTSGKELRDIPPSDEEIKQKVDAGEELADNNFQIDKESITLKSDNNNQFSNIEVPLKWVIGQTGYYRIDISAQLGRIKFESGKEKKMVLDNTAIFPTSDDKLDETKIQNKWNNHNTSIYIAVYDGTKPQQNIPKQPIEIVPLKEKANHK